MFSTDLIAAIKAVSNIILSDMPAEYCRNRAVIAETVLDASRLELFGYPQEYQELKGLFIQFGYATVHKEAMTHVYVA